MNSLISFFARHKTLGDVITIAILALGIYSLTQIRREVFPNVTFDIITVQTVYPGASPEEIEKLITNPIEQDLQEVDGLKRVRSISTEGFSSIIIFLDPDQTTEERAKSDIKDVVDRVTLPTEAEAPLINSIESKQSPIIEVSLSSPLPEIELRQVAKDIEKELERLPGVARVVPVGLRDLEIRVQADPNKLARLSISLDEVVQALRLQNRSIPAGTTEPLPTDPTHRQKVVRTVGEFNDLDDVKSTVIRANELAQPIQISDVAHVNYELARSRTITRTNGLNSISLTVLKKEMSDGINTVDDVLKKMEGLGPLYEKVEFSYINDLSEYIRRRISILSNNMAFGLTFIIILLALFLPWKIAVVVSVGISIAFVGAILVFYNFGLSINLISLMGLILVCGMLVDDAVVVADNIYRHMEEKPDDPIKSAISGAIEIWPAITASVSTTMIAFIPMLFMTGIFGKFIQQIPMAVIIALLLSLFEALLILPQHMAHYVKIKKLEEETDSNLGDLAKIPKKKSPNKKIQTYWDNTVVPTYLSIVNQSIRLRYGVAALLLVFFAVTGLAAKYKLDFILFPPDGVEIFFVRVQSPVGSSLEYTSENLKPIEDLISQLPENEVQDYVTTVGITQQDPNDPNTKRGSEYGQIAVFLTPESKRDRIANEIIEDLRKQIGNPESFIALTFDRVNPGPPVGKPISVGVRGKEYEDILLAVEDLKAKVINIEGTSDITDSYTPGKDEIHLVVNRAEAAAAGLSVAQIGNTVRAAFDGIIATSILRLDDEVEVRVQFPLEYRATEESLSKIQIPNNRGNLIPLLRVARPVETVGMAAYEHENNEREVRITGELDTQVTSATRVSNQIRSLVPELIENHPNVSVHFGGEDEDTKESMDSLMRAFVVAMIGIFFLLVLTFNNIFQPFLVILTIPLGLCSVIWTLFVMGMPLSFMAMLGVIALGGVIVNNSIVLIDFINQARKKGMGRFESILHASGIRLRPIFLTTLTTVAGLLPTAHGIGGKDMFVVPIAMALGYGLLFGSILTIFIFPAFIAITDDLRLLVSKQPLVKKESSKKGSFEDKA